MSTDEVCFARVGLLALSYYASHSNKLKQMVGVNKLKQMVGVAINTYLVAQRELEYHLVTLLCSQSIHVWSPRGSLNNI